MAPILTPIMAPIRGYNRKFLKEQYNDILMNYKNVGINVGINVGVNVGVSVGVSVGVNLRSRLQKRPTKRPIKAADKKRPIKTADKIEMIVEYLMANKSAKTAEICEDEPENATQVLSC